MIFKLYFPNAQGNTDEHFHRAGIGQLCRDCGPDWEDVIDGPLGMGYGKVAQWKQQDPTLNAPDGIPEKFKWHPSPPTELYGEKVAKGAYYIGFDPNVPPGPSCLERTKQYHGSDVQLNDGRSWTIPAANLLPHTIAIDEDTGERVSEMEPEFARYCGSCAMHAAAFYSRHEQIALLNRFYKKQLSAEDMKQIQAMYDDKNFDGIEGVNPEELHFSIPLDDAVDHAHEALSLNYRITPHLAGLLKLLDNSAVITICLAAMDALELAEALKKNEPESPIILPGTLPI